METNRPFRISPQLVLGLIVITLGVLFTLDNLDIINSRDYLRYWPVLLIIFGVAKMLQPVGSPGKLWGFILTFIGAVLLLNRLHILGFYIWDYWPLILVFLGGSMILRSTTGRRVFGGSYDDSGSLMHGIAVMGGFRRSSTSQDFRGGEFTAIMGGCEIDLRQASIKEPEAIVDVFVIWGGVVLRVPEDWSVQLQGIPLMGAFEDKTRPPSSESAKKLIVKGTAIMGGVDIKN